MQIALVGGSYLYWHYVSAWGNMWALWKNVALFLRHFFSLGLFTRTFFTPWKRMQEEKRRGFSLEEFFSRILVNTILRFVGMVPRAVVIALGSMALVIHCLLGVVIFLVWAFIPIILVAVFLKGIIMIFNEI